MIEGARPRYRTRKRDWRFEAARQFEGPHSLVGASPPICGQLSRATDLALASIPIHAPMSRGNQQMLSLVKGSVVDDGIRPQSAQYAISEESKIPQSTASTRLLIRSFRFDEFPNRPGPSHFRILDDSALLPLHTAYGFY